ncbi:MAG: MFS transporter [Candidatus Bathyarchaeota archaeon]|nr:MAG: MFS transporter [Candidatus Bathyarchaeota archaeon]
MDSRKQGSLLNYGLLSMAFSHTLIHVFARIHPALFPVFRDEFALTLQQLVFIAAAPYLGSTILSIPSGFFADKFGSRKVLIICFLIAGAATVAISQSNDPIMLTASISIIIMMSTIYHPASFSYVTKIFSETRGAQALGIHNAGGTLGFALGPLSLSIFVGSMGWGWRSLYFFWTIPIFIVVIAIMKLTPTYRLNQQTPEDDTQKDREDVEKSQFKSLFSTQLIIFLTFVTLRMFSGSIYSDFVPTFLHDEQGLSITQASLVYGTVSLMGVVAGPLGGYFADRVGRKRWLMFAVSGNALCLLIAVLMPTALLFISFYFLSSFCGGCGMAANTSIVTSLTPSRQRGMAYALFFLPGSLMGAIAPIIGATIADSFGLIVLFPISIIISAISIAVLKFGVNV